eukprot:Tbor_TRINITY_DN6019_c1_g3::TRINITY_DN6019_c1_g3_i3::g.11240::m.11240
MRGYNRSCLKSNLRIQQRPNSTVLPRKNKDSSSSDEIDEEKMSMGLEDPVIDDNEEGEEEEEILKGKDKVKGKTTKIWNRFLKILDNKALSFEAIKHVKDRHKFRGLSPI